jgi:two-component system, chemotaxis family, chemotaxis protein CheY
MGNTVLVTDDSPDSSKLLKKFLEKMGFSVVESADGYQTMNILENGEVDDWACFVSDIKMPEMEGMELLKRVKSSEKHKDTPFILLTAVVDHDYIREAKELGVSGYIVKPISYDRVLKEFKELFPDHDFSKK